MFKIPNKKKGQKPEEPRQIAKLLKTLINFLANAIMHHHSTKSEHTQTNMKYSLTDPLKQKSTQ